MADGTQASRGLELREKERAGMRHRFSHHVGIVPYWYLTRGFVL